MDNSNLKSYGIACVDKETLRVRTILFMNSEIQKIHDENGWVDEDYILKYQGPYADRYQRVIKPDQAQNYLYIKCATYHSTDPSKGYDLSKLRIRNNVRIGYYWSPETKCFYHRNNKRELAMYPSWILKPVSGHPHNELPPVCWAAPPIPKPNLRGEIYDWSWYEEAGAWVNVWWRDEADDTMDWIDFYSEMIQSEDLSDEEMKEIKEILESKIVYLAEMEEKAAEEDERIQKLIDAKAKGGN